MRTWRIGGGRVTSDVCVHGSASVVWAAVVTRVIAVPKLNGSLSLELLPFLEYMSTFFASDFNPALDSSSPSSSRLFIQ